MASERNIDESGAYKSSAGEANAGKASAGKASAAEMQRGMNHFYCEINELYHGLAINYGLSDSVLWILFTLNDERRPCTPKEIGEMCALSKQTVHSSLRSLEKDGYISITVSEENRKNRLAELTEKGMKLIDRTIAPIVDAELRAFSGLEDSEGRELLRLMGKYQMLLRQETDKLIQDRRS